MKLEFRDTGKGRGPKRPPVPVRLVCGATAAAIAAALMPAAVWMALADDFSETAEAAAVEQTAEVQEPETGTMRISTADGAQTTATLEVSTETGWQTAGTMGLTGTAVNCDGLESGTYRITSTEEIEELTVTASGTSYTVAESRLATGFSFDAAAGADVVVTMATEDEPADEPTASEEQPNALPAGEAAEEPADEEAAELPEDEVLEEDMIVEGEDLDEGHDAEDPEYDGQEWGDASCGSGHEFTISVTGRGFVVVETIAGKQRINAGSTETLLVEDWSAADIHCYAEGLMPAVTTSVSTPGGMELEPTLSIADHQHERDVTALGDRAISIVLSGVGNYLEAKGVTDWLEKTFGVEEAWASASQPAVGETFTFYGGNVVSTTTDGYGSVTNVKAKLSGGTGHFAQLNGWEFDFACAYDHAAAPYAGQHIDHWTFKVTSVNKTTGRVDGYLVAYPDGYTVGNLAPNGYPDGYQWISMNAYVTGVSYQGRIKLYKRAWDPGGITAGNPCYDLSGAVYGIYSTQAAANAATPESPGSPVDRITCGTEQIYSGKPTAITPESKLLNAGRYYIKELTAPKGYQLNTRVYYADVSGGTTGWVYPVGGGANDGYAYDAPANDPAAMWVQKVDAETGEPSKIAGLNYAGAEFTVIYYSGQYGEDVYEDPAAYEAAMLQAEADVLAGNAIKRTWVVTTGEDGYADLSDEFKISGDDFFKNENGQVIVPIGTIFIQETKAPESLLINEDAYYVRHVTGDEITGQDPVSYNAPIAKDTPIRNGLEISKTVIGADNEECEGIGFFLTDEQGERVSWEDESGQTVDEVYLDGAGKASTPTDALLYGEYTIHEDKATIPDGFVWYGDAQGNGPDDDVVATVDISEDYTTHAIYTAEVVNYAKVDAELIKIDGDSLRDAGSAEAAEKVEGSEWTLTFLADDQGTEYNEEVFKGTTNADGILELGGALDRWGTYRLEETRPAPGYLTPEASGKESYVDFTFDGETYELCGQGAEESGWTYTEVDGKPAIVRTEANWAERQIESVKKDQDTDAPVPDTEFRLYKYIGAEDDYDQYSGQARAATHDTYITRPDETIDEDVWELKDSGITDTNGAFIFEGLDFGHWMVVEAVPNIDYAEWWESADSAWDRYWFDVDADHPKRQTQIFRNDRIELETTVDKSTIEVTSAAFNSLGGQPVNYRNVDKELYRYDVAFTNGTTNVRADQYTVIDDFDFTALGIRLDALWTPTVTNDTDGTFNVWYRTNKTDGATVYSTASATADNPYNQMTDGTDRIPTTGWRLWAEGVGCGERRQLEVSDLGLADGEYVTGVMLELGSVEVGLASDEPLSYLVRSTTELKEGTVIPNTAHSHITRNWNAPKDGEDGPSGLYDDDTDKVQTRVIGTFSYDATTSTWVPDNGGNGTGSRAGATAFGRALAKTGDMLAHWWWLLAMLAAAAAIATASLRRKEKERSE